MTNIWLLVQLHGEMCKGLCAMYVKVLAIFPDLEAARPRSTSGIQALCALHIALEKTKNVLQHCADCSKLYLAITGDSVVLKFEKARCALEDSLKRVEDIVPQAIGGQIAEILVELGRIEFSLDPVEKQIGDEIIALLQQGRNFSSSNDNNELESFHQAAGKLGITSSRAALRERRALKKLIERARAEEDKRKESIIAYLLHLMRKYSKLFRSELSDDNDSQGSTPCSPTVQGSLDDGVVLGRNGCAFDRQLSKLSSFNFKPNFRRSEQMHVPPEEVWLLVGANRMGFLFQMDHQSHSINYWRLVLSESDSANSKSLESVGSCKFKGVKVVPLNDSGIIEEAEGNEEEAVSSQEDDCEAHAFERYEDFLKILEEDDLMKKIKVVEQIRHLLKDDEEARIYMGANGFVEALLRFLESAVSARNRMGQEVGAMALFNLAVNNNRNKELMLAAGVLPILEKMIAITDAVGAATALYLNLSCLEEAKPVIGSSEAVPFLIWILKNESDGQCKLDALHALYNISSSPANIPQLLTAGIIDALQALITHPSDHTWTEKCIAVLIYLASSKTARDQIIVVPGLISALATILDVGEPVEQEQAAACLLILCNSNETCSQMVLQEGVIPSLVSISVNGTVRGKQKAQKLLMLFREQRQRDPSPVPTRPRPETNEEPLPAQDSKPLSKSVSRRKVGKAFSFWRKNKSFSVYQC
ncbi:UNVERIFIED_CONTAM: U-box domain-containing protein 45 [Sesamum latifolium]|uniref:U-box domain-containing protein 45 n=1 Tax=Sesamum latifolium TaxID=2727402 RepID=A0AAW2UXS0_9LAMI